MTIHTSTGCRFYIGPVAGTSIDTADEFEALAFTEIVQIQDLGDFGDAAEDVSFAVVNDDRLHYRKGSVDGGVLPLVLSYDPDDDGQAALKAASASRSNYAFKVELGGVPGAPPAEEVFYFRGRVLRHKNDIGGTDRVLSVNSEIAINSAIVASTASLTVDSTEATVDSDIISVDAG
jgi:hypothetical protein